MRRTVFIACVTASCLGCTTPGSTVPTIDDRPSLVILGASGEATLLVDGLPLGRAVEYDGSSGALRLDSGRHRVTITDSTGTVYDRDISLESETRSISVR